MDLFKLLKSLEEFLYEIIVLLVFYPRTMWLSLRFPQRMMDYADTELGDVQAEQYTDTVSPPLFLMITIGLTYLAGFIMPVQGLPSEAPPLLSDTERLLTFRVLSFSMLPLFLSLRLLSDLGVKLDRETLRAPFYSQCFVTAPFAMVVGLGIMGTALGPDAVIPAVAIIAVSCLWFVRQQAHWFANKRGTGLLRGWTTASATFLLSWSAIVLIGFVVVSVPQ